MHAAEDEHQEARFVTGEIRRLSSQYEQFAVLYRTNAQSRALEEALIRENIAYQIIGGVRFWERKEVKDILAYLRVLDNPADDISLLRIINVPRRGIGSRTIERLQALAAERNCPLAEILPAAQEAGLTSAPLKKVSEFTALLENLHKMREYLSLDELVEQVITKSGYLEDLRSERTEQAQSREENLREFITVAQEFQRTSEEQTLTAFLTQLALLTDLDTLSQEDAPRVVLMTLHAAKGLEFPVVFMTGMEEVCSSYAPSRLQMGSKKSVAYVM